jgi:hypothetical protein
MRNRAAETDWRTYLDASLFPLKIYTALAVIGIMARYALLPTDDVLGMLTADFYTFASFVAGGYLLSGLILITGGIIQGGFCSQRASLWSLSFAGAALIIGFSMARFAGGVAEIHGPFYVCWTLF